MFTEPADQSVWWYHHFLLTWAEDGAGNDTADRFENVLRSERDTLTQLVEVEGRCKVCRGRGVGRNDWRRRTTFSEWRSGV